MSMHAVQDKGQGMATQHNVNSFLQLQESKLRNEPTDLAKKPSNPPSLSPRGDVWRSSPPYISPIISPSSSFPSFMPLSPSTTMNIVLPQTSPTSLTAFMPLSTPTLMDLTASRTSPTSVREFTPSSELSREMFSGAPSSVRFHLSPASSPPQVSVYPTQTSSNGLFSASTSSKSSISLVLPSKPETTSPGLSSSRDSGISSPAPAENKKENVPDDKCKTKKGQKKASTRTNFTADQIKVLQKLFEKNPYPDIDTMETVAMELHLSEKQVKIWFQNRRARHRRRRAGSKPEDQRAMTSTQPRIYAPMTPVGYPACVTMPMTTPVTMPMTSPMYAAPNQSYASPEMSFRPELLRNRPVESFHQSWNHYGQTPATSRNMQSMNNQYPVHTAWSGLYPC